MPCVNDTHNARDSAHDFNVKLSPGLCSHSSGEMDYQTHVTAEAAKSCCYAWFVCYGKVLNQQCAAHSGVPLDYKSTD